MSPDRGSRRVPRSRKTEPRETQRREPQRRETRRRQPSGEASAAESPTAIALTDTHSLLWAGDATKRRKLGRGARAYFDRVERREAALFVPTIVLVEVGELQHLGRIRLQPSFEQWLTDLIASRVFIPVDLTTEIVRHAQQLYDIPERGDRLIAATAVAMNVPLISRDPDIAACAHVERIWD